MFINLAKERFNTKQYKKVIAIIKVIIQLQSLGLMYSK